jgi:CheY-like chemotaxis protein
VFERRDRKNPGFTMAQKNPRSHAALILVVDDDQAVVEITAEILETLGYDILTAQDGSEAVELLRSNSRISVLFTDIQMPGIGGKELAEIAVMLRPGIRVIFTSGFQTPPGNAAFVPKPYRAVDLIRVLPPQPLPSLRT